MTETTVWVDVDGGQTTLEVEWATSGRFMPKIEFNEDIVAGQPGARLRSVRHAVHELVVPFWFDGATEADQRTQMRNICDLMDPTRGPGKIRVTSPVGDQREIVCSYAAGLEVDEKLGDNAGLFSQMVPVMFRGHDPYWYDVTTTTPGDFQATSTPSFFPFFPLRLSSSEIVVDTTITNDGSVETWPTWTIYGPGSGVVLRNLTTGKNLLMTTVTLSTGQYITVDTRPDYKTVRRDDGTNMWSVVDFGSALWSLNRGANRIRLEMTGTTPLVSRLQVSYKRRFLAP